MPDLAQFTERLARENHTLKRSLTDPRLFSGIGNAYSDEILHRAKLSPVKHTKRLTEEEIAAPVRRDAHHSHRVDGSTARRIARRFPGEGDRVSRRDGRARQVRQAVPGVRDSRPANSLRRQRDELLRALPDRRQAARRSRAVSSAEGGLAALDRRANLELGSSPGST